MFWMRHAASAQAGGLLRLLFVRHGEVPADPSEVLLRLIRRTWRPISSLVDRKARRRTVLRVANG